MNARRVLLGAVGVVCLLLGTAVEGVGTSLTEAFSGAGGDYVLVGVLSGLALLATIPVLVSGRESELEQSETPDPEVPVQVPPAGREFDEAIRGWHYRTPLVGDEPRRRVKERLRTAAEEAVMHDRNCGRSRARRLVRRGEWTDDDEAAAFLGSPQRSTVSTFFAAAPRRQTPAEFRARRAADAVYALDRGDGR